MNVPTWQLVVVVVAAFVALYLRGLVGRLDRLHLRVETTAEALDAQLLRRSSSVLELGSAAVLDPASSLILVSAATAAQTAGALEREVVESALSEDLRVVLDSPGVLEQLQSAPGGSEQLAELAQATDRVALAHRFHNDAVRSVRELRSRPVVRLLRLAGRAALPQSFEMDDAPPAVLSAVDRAPT
ncbi:MAG: hypothetical protein OEV62_07015 [Actinomycetota bacterium]|nr:hypothetical protein [Actinomycetota bacterium]